VEKLSTSLVLQRGCDWLVGLQPRGGNDARRGSINPVLSKFFSLNIGIGLSSLSHEHVECVAMTSV
jgi:hypothetical protein